eukprot:m.28396 g.28396  ORF g.28396 m.28396 type:complete len:338 (+) comp8821_c0_seq1:71-1084(+)
MARIHCTNPEAIIKAPTKMPVLPAPPNARTPSMRPHGPSSDQLCSERWSTLRLARALRMPSNTSAAPYAPSAYSLKSSPVTSPCPNHDRSASDGSNHLSPAFSAFLDSATITMIPTALTPMLDASTNSCVSTTVTCDMCPPPILKRPLVWPVASQIMTWTTPKNMAMLPTTMPRFRDAPRARSPGKMRKPGGRFKSFAFSSVARARAPRKIKVIAYMVSAARVLMFSVQQSRRPDLLSDLHHSSPKAPAVLWNSTAPTITMPIALRADINCTRLLQLSLPMVGCEIKGVETGVQEEFKSVQQRNSVCKVHNRWSVANGRFCLVCWEVGCMCGYVCGV